MTTINEQDLLRYAEGEIQDEDELDRIEAAIDNDRALARQFAELQAEWEPAPDVLDYIREKFQVLDASIWVRLEVRDVDPAVGRPETANLELPGAQVIDVSVHASADKVRLTMNPPPQGWRAASIALFHVHTIGHGPLEISVGDPAIVTPAERAAADAGLVLAAESALDLACDHDDSGWSSKAAEDSAGGRAWLVNSDEGLMLMVNLSESAGLVEQVRYRLDWYDSQKGQMENKDGTVPLISNAGRQVAMMPLDLPAAAVRHSPFWTLQVLPIRRKDPPYVDNTDFRDLVGDDLQSLILNATAENAEDAEEQQTVLEAVFQGDRQRAMWNDNTAACWVRFETN